MENSEKVVRAGACGFLKQLLYMEILELILRSALRNRVFHTRLKEVILHVLLGRTQQVSSQVFTKFLRFL